MYTGCHGLSLESLFITGCHQPNTAAFSAPGSTLPLLSLPLCQLQQLCVSWIIKAPAWQLDQPSTRLGPSWVGRLVSLRAHCWCHLPTAREGAGAGGLGLNCLFCQHSGLCQKQLESCTPRDNLCKDEVLISSASGPLSVCPLENVLPC